MATTATPTSEQTYQQADTAATEATVTAGTIVDRWETSQKATLRERRSFWINSAFLADEQYIAWNTHAGHLVEVPPDGDRLQLREDRLLPSSRSIIAKLIKRPLMFEVPPTSADDASVDGSRTAAAVLADVHHRHNWEEFRRQLAWKVWKGGVAGVVVEWDPKAGTPLGTTETGKHFGTGDIVETVLTVAEIGAEPGCRDLERGRWFIKASALPPGDVKAMFNMPTEPAADASAGLSPLQRQLIGGPGSSNENTIRLTRVLTYFERPNGDSKGMVATVVAGEFVDGGAKPWPYPFNDRLPIVAVRETPHDDDWLADTILSHAISPQRTLNQAITSRAEHMKEAGNARLGVPEAAGDEWDSLSDVPEVVRYNGQTPPGWISPPAMPAWWIEAAQESRNAIDDILGRHDISRGDAPAGIHSGVALSLLAEQDDTPLGMLSKEMAEAWGRYASLVLAIYEQKVTEPREAVVARSGQAPERVTWSGNDLAGQTTAVVPLEAVSPRSDAAQMELAFRLKGVYPELDLKTFAGIASLPNAGDLTEAVDPDVAKARRENGEMAANGEPVIPAAFDDHSKHITEHNVFRKSARYEALDDQVREVIDAHVDGHAADAAAEAGSQLGKAEISPALAAAAQANEPTMAGKPDALQQMQDAQNAGMSAAPPMAPPGGSAGAAPSGAIDQADGQQTPPSGAQ